LKGKEVLGRGQVIMARGNVKAVGSRSDEG